MDTNGLGSLKQCKCKYNLLGSDFLVKYDADIRVGKRLLILYNKDKKVEIPFTYVRTFPKHIYQLNSNINRDKQENIFEESKKPNRPEVNLDSCIEFQPDALDYFSAKDIQEIKERINSENQEHSKAIHKQI